MYCSNCGTRLSGDEKFCSKCGKLLKVPAVSIKESQKPEIKKRKNGLFYAFTISNEELNRQIVNYNTLPISESSRGKAVITIAILLGLGAAIVIGWNLLSSSDAPLSYSDEFWSLLIYIPLLYFVYRGHLWAIIGLGAYYTIDKIATTFLFTSTHFNIGAIIFWLIGIGPIWVAFRVERAHRRSKMMNAVS